MCVIKSNLLSVYLRLVVVVIKYMNSSSKGMVRWTPHNSRLVVATRNCLSFRNHTIRSNFVLLGPIYIFFSAQIANNR